MVGANGENSQKSAKDGGSTVVGGFEILSRIGRGGMGAVYKARQVSLDRIVALKILPPSLAKRQDFVTRFMREARAAGQLRHPNIVGGIDIGEADGYHPGEGLLVTEVGSLGGWKGTMKTRCGRPPKERWTGSTLLKAGGLGSPGKDGTYLVFGSRTGNETWSFDPVNGTWTELQPKVSPPPRANGRLVHHDGLAVWVLAGGHRDVGYVSDIWLYAPHLGTWLELTSEQAPQMMIMMWYDRARDRIVAFCGRANGRCETWTLKLTPQ